jgi:hypothetical protein
MTPARDRYLEAFLSDLENWCLAWPRWDARLGMPRGKFRWMDPVWSQVVLSHIDDYPRQTWEDYIAYCLAGRGDEWFQFEERESTEFLRCWPCTCEDPYCTVLVNGDIAGDLHSGRQTFCTCPPHQGCPRGRPDNYQASSRVRPRAA